MKAIKTLCLVGLLMSIIGTSTSLSSLLASSSRIPVGSFYGVSYGVDANYTFLSVDSTNISSVARYASIGDPNSIDVASSLSVIQGGFWHAPVYIGKTSCGIISFNMSEPTSYIIMELPQRVVGLIPLADDQLIIITAPEHTGTVAVDVYIGHVPLKSALLKRIGSFGALTPVAHVRTLTNSANGSPSPSSSMLYMQLYDPNSVDTRPFIGVMNLATGTVSRRSLPVNTDLDSLWYHADNNQLYALMLNTTSFYLAKAIDDGESSMSFESFTTSPFYWLKYRGIGYDRVSGHLFVTFVRYSATQDTALIAEIDLVSGVMVNQWNLNAWLLSLLQFGR